MSFRFNCMILAAFLALLNASPAEAQTTVATFDSNGTSIRYAIAGSGEAVVLIHGWMGDATMWGADAQGNPRLSPPPGFQTIALDLRGHGKSGKPHDVNAYGTEMALDVIRLLDHLKVEKAHLVGYSMGSYVAGKVVERIPHRVLSVVYGGSAPVLRTRAVKAFGDAVAFADAVKSGSGLGDYILATMPRGFPKPTPEVAAKMAEMRFRHQDVVALAAAGRSLGQLEVDPAALKRGRVPTLFLYGEKESSYVRDRISEAKRWHPHAQYTVVPGTDHVTTLRAPLFGQTLVAFLNAHRSAAR